MNIIDFRNNVSSNEEFLEKAKIYRAMIENAYRLFICEKKLAIEFIKTNTSNEEVLSSENEDWSYISLSSISKILGTLGINYKELVNQEMRYSNNANYPYPYFYFQIEDLWSEIEKLDNNIDFMYVTVYLSKEDLNKSIDLYIGKVIRNSLKQLDINSITEPINKEIADKVFVAMWFDDSMKKCRKAITEAIKECGYKENFIDMKEHNNQIVPEIFHEIKQSKFVIADLTGNRGGVYYEAGYAEALAKVVILTIRKEKDNGDNQPHFDVAQKNTIYWEDENLLKVKLIERIVATVGINN